MRPSFTPPACRSCWPATYNVVPTELRHLPDEVLGQGCAACSRKPRRLPAHCSSRAGWTRSARCIRTSRCTRSGTTCGTAGRAMRACASTHLLLSPRRRGAPRQRRRRPRRARQGRRQRSRAGLGRAARRREQSRRSRAAATVDRQGQSAAGERARRRAAKRDAGTAGLCWSSTATRSRIAPITRCRKPSCGAAARAPARSSASPIFCCGSTRPSSRAPCWWPGTRSTRRPIGTSAFPAYQSGRAVRRRAARAARRAAGIRRRVRLRQCEGRGLRGRRFPRRGGRGRGAARRHGAGRERRPRHVSARVRPRPRSSTRCAPARWRASARRRCASAMASSPSRCRISSRCAAIPSDKLPGAPASARRVPPTSSRRYGTLEAVLAAGRFPAQADMLRLFRSIATMDAAAPLPPLADQVPNWARASALARAWELTRLADRLAEMGARAGRK